MYEYRKYGKRAVLKSLFCLISIVLFLSGCAASRGFDRGNAMESVPLKNLTYDDIDIKKAFELKPQMAFPARIGMFFSGGVREFSAEDKDILLNAEEDLRDAGIVTELVLIDDSLVGYPYTEKKIRTAAARYGTDAVFIIHGDYDVSGRSNIASVLYLSIVGMWVIPGSHRDIRYISDGTLMDTRNGYIYLSVEQNAEGSVVGPLMLVEEDVAIKEARSEAMKQMRDDFVERITSKGFSESLFSLQRE